VAAPDLECGSKASRPRVRSRSRLVSRWRCISLMPSKVRASDENGRGDSGALAHDIEHEVRAIIEKNIGVARARYIERIRGVGPRK